MHHDFVDEQAELGDLRLHAGEVLGPLIGRQIASALEELDVRAKTRERRPEFMPGILDEATLLLPTRTQRPQHLVKAGGEPANLVAARKAERSEIARGCDTFGRRCQIFERLRSGDMTYRRTGFGGVIRSRWTGFVR